MTVWVTRNDGVVEDFTRSADHYVEHFDGSLEVIRGGTAPPESFRPGAGPPCAETADSKAADISAISSNASRVPRALTGKRDSRNG